MAAILRASSSRVAGARSGPQRQVRPFSQTSQPTAQCSVQLEQHSNRSAVRMAAGAQWGRTACLSLILVAGCPPIRACSRSRAPSVLPRAASSSMAQGRVSGLGFFCVSLRHSPIRTQKSSDPDSLSDNVHCFVSSLQARWRLRCVDVHGRLASRSPRPQAFEPSSTSASPQQQCQHSL